MKRIVLALALVALLAAPMAMAGEGHCTAGTQECLDMMAKKLKNKGMMGIEGDWNEEEKTYTVNSFIDGMNAREAGLRLGDVLVAVNGIKLGDEEGYKKDLENRKPGKKVIATVLRNGEKVKLPVVLSGMNDEQIAKYIGMHMMDHVQMAKADGHKH